MSFRDRLRSIGGSSMPPSGPSSPPIEAEQPAERTPSDPSDSASSSCHSERSEESTSSAETTTCDQEQPESPEHPSLTPALSQREREQDAEGQGEREQTAGVSASASPYGTSDDIRRRLFGLGVGLGTQGLVRRERAPLRWAHPIEAVVEGKYRDTPAGPCYCVEHSYPIQHPHGRLSLGGMLEMPPEIAVFWGRDGSLASFDPRHAAFLDLETTGLAGGTGTYAFMVGIGQVVGDEFRVRQYFLREYGEERAQLLAVSEALSQSASLVTFNGKCFDWPLLSDRFTYSRLRPALSDPMHLDLLYPARRLWRHRLESRSLGSLEQNILGIYREDDTPGWLIPSLYFQYLTERDARPLRGVFEHNRLDLLSLAALTGLFGQLGPRVCRPAEWQIHPDVESLLGGADHYGLGRALEDAGHLEESALSYERALQYEMSNDLRERVLSRLSLLYKRLRQSEQAVDIWARMLEAGGASALWPCIELAKHYEHKEKDYTRADEMVLRALTTLSLRRGFGQVAREREELEHRLKRIRGKQGKRGGS